MRPNSGPTATVVIATTRFDDDFTALTTDHGFRVESIFPADAPHTAVVSGGSLRLRLESHAVDIPATIHIDVGDVGGGDGDAAPGGRAFSPIVLPGGTRIEPSTDLSAQTAAELSTLNDPGSVVVTPADGSVGVGRAGMRYRDLLPDRWDGRYIVSHINIPDGGPVPDYVHYHRIGFQMIFVKAGWVEVVYEDQGDPFVMNPGDCVLQPPEIRHRVLESSPGLEVIEIGTPALHETIADWSMELPNGVGDPAREWAGQRFVRHVAEEATYQPWVNNKWVCRDTGIGEATQGVASAIVARPGTNDGAAARPTFVNEHAFASITVLSGAVTAQIDTETADECLEPHRLEPGASVTLPPGAAITFRSPTEDCELLVVTHRAALAAHPDRRS